MSEIFLTKASPFFNFGKILSLKKIPRKDFTRFLSDAFKKIGLDGTDTIVREILDLTQCHPHYTQMFAYQVWETAVHQKEPSPNLRNVIEQIIRFQQDAYISLWSLLTQRQKKLLICLAHDELRPLTGADVVSRWELGSSATVVKVIAALDKEGFIERTEKNRVEIADPFFKKWIQNFP